MRKAVRDLSRSGTLYSVLGVAPDASALEIRRAYRAIQFELHPDRRKNRESAAAASAEFSIVSEAYEVLSDDDRRDLYDAIGLDGLRLFEWIQRIVGTGGPAPVLPPIVLASAMCLVGAALALLLAMSLLLAALWHDGSLAALPWTLLGLPLLAANPFLVVVGGLLTAHGPTDGRAAMLRMLPAITLLAAFEVLLCVKLEAISAMASRSELDEPSGAASLPWIFVFTPLLVSRGAALAALPAQLDATRRAAARWVVGHDEAPNLADAITSAGGANLAPRHVSDRHREFGVMALRMLRRVRRAVQSQVQSQLDAPLTACMRQGVWVLLGACQLVLIPPRLEGLLICQWRWLLVPTWLWVVLEGMVTAMAARREEKQRLESAASGAGTGTPPQQFRRALRQAGRGGWLAALVSISGGLLWVGGRMDETDQGHAPAVELWAPLLIGLGGVAGCAGCVCVCAASARRAAWRAWRRERGERRGQRSGGGEEGEGDSEGVVGDDSPPGPLHVVPAEGDVDPSEVIRAAFAPMPRGKPLPGAMPAVARASRVEAPEAAAPEEGDWAVEEAEFEAAFFEAGGAY